MLSCRVLESGLLSVLEGELDGGVPGLALATGHGLDIGPTRPSALCKPNLPLCAQPPRLTSAHPELQSEPIWQRTGTHMTNLGRMDGSEPGLTSANLEAPGTLLSAPLNHPQNEGIQGTLILAFLACTTQRHVSETHRKPPPRACGFKKPEGGGGGRAEKGFI